MKLVQWKIDPHEMTTIPVAQADKVLVAVTKVVMAVVEIDTNLFLVTLKTSRAIGRFFDDKIYCFRKSSTALLNTTGLSRFDRWPALTILDNLLLTILEFKRIAFL